MLVSTGFKTLILGPNSFSDIFNGGMIILFANNQPASPDLSDSAALEIGRITNYGLPWNFGNPTNGLNFVQQGPYISSGFLPPWICIPTMSDTATWFRLYSASALEGRADSTDLPRIDGTISQEGMGIPADCYMSDPGLIAGVSQDFNYFLYTILPLPI